MAQGDDTEAQYRLKRAATGIAGTVALAVGALVMPSAALAQRTEQNAATQSDDAFGRTIGNERSGLYTGTDVRGFNPSEAGNIRLNGLYFDLVNLISARQIEGHTVRVGIAAQRYPFPAPTVVCPDAITSFCSCLKDHQDTCGRTGRS